MVIAQEQEPDADKIFDLVYIIALVKLGGCKQCGNTDQTEFRQSGDKILCTNCSFPNDRPSSLRCTLLKPSSHTHIRSKRCSTHQAQINILELGDFYYYKIINIK